MRRVGDDEFVNMHISWFNVGSELGVDAASALSISCMVAAQTNRTWDCGGSHLGMNSRDHGVDVSIVGDESAKEADLLRLFPGWVVPAQRKGR